MSTEIDVEKVIAKVEKLADAQVVTGNEPVWCQPLRDLAAVTRALHERLLAVETAPAAGKPKR